MVKPSEILLQSASAAPSGAVDMSVIGLIAQSDLIVQGIMLLLLAASFWSWAIIFDKWFKFRDLKLKTNKFEKLFWSGQLLDQLYERIRDHATHPMAMIFVAAMHEWEREANDDPAKQQSHLRTGLKERIFQAMTVARNRSLEPIEKNLTFLATVGSAAPFVGLFGTVWGIVHSFQSIAMTKNTTLAVVAPGIAEALLATAIGLFAAIPAVIFYNIYTNDLNRQIGRLDDFSSELGALLSRELDG